MKQKNKEDEFSSMVLVTLDANLLRNLLTGKGKIRAGEGTIWAGKETIRADKGTVSAG